MLFIWWKPRYTMVMWFLGKQLKQPPTKLNLPPELSSFYGSQIARGLKVRRAIALFILIAIVVAAALAGLWLHDLGTSQPKLASTQSTPKTTPSIAVQSTPKSVSSVTSLTSTNTMPNTGPGTDIFLAAFGLGSIAAIGYHLRLHHRARQAESKF
jgi:hypothetical protein